jgi:hypothetical protein
MPWGEMLLTLRVREGLSLVFRVSNNFTDSKLKLPWLPLIETFIPLYIIITRRLLKNSFHPFDWFKVNTT